MGRWRAHRVAAELWRACTDVRRRGHRKTYRRRQGNPRRQFPGGGGQQGIPAREGDDGAYGCHHVARDRQPTGPERSRGGADATRVAGQHDFRPGNARRGAGHAEGELYAALPVWRCGRAPIRSNSASSISRIRAAATSSARRRRPSAGSPAESRPRTAATALPSRATKTSPFIAPSRPRSKSTARPAARA